MKGNKDEDKTVETSAETIVKAPKKPVKGNKKVFIVIIAAILVVLIGVGVTLGVVLTKQSKPEKVIELYCKAYNAEDTSKLEKVSGGEVSDDAFNVVKSYEVVSFSLKTENDVYAYGEAILKCELKDGKTVTDSFAIYFKKEGINWKLFSMIDYENRCTDFMKVK